MLQITNLFRFSSLNLERFLPFELNLRRREAIAGYLFLAPFMAFFAVFTVRAVILAVQTSFYQYHVLRPARPYIELDNYKELLADDVWWKSLENTIMFASLTVIGTTIIGLLAAILVTQPVRGQGFFRVVLYMPSLFSVGSVGLIWVWLLSNQFGAINYGLNELFNVKPINWLGNPDLVIPSLSFTTIWWSFGFPMLIFIAGLQGIPESLYEAARIDGANKVQIFFYITLPLLRPTILFVTVTGLISHFQVYGQVLIMTSGGPGRESYTVIYYLWEVAWRAFRMGYGSAVAVTLAFFMAVATAVQFFVIGGRRVDY